MMIVGSPLAGALITKFGPRVPLVGGMVCTAVAMFGMSGLDADTGTRASCPSGSRCSASASPR